MNRFWPIYFFLIIAYEIMIILVLNQKKQFDLTFSDLFFVFFVVGLYGLAFQRKILFSKVWKVIFAFSFIVFFHTWVVMPLIYKFSKGFAASKIAFIQLFSVPSIPLFVALYIYAWHSEKIWRSSTELSPLRGRAKARRVPVRRTFGGE